MWLYLCYWLTTEALQRDALARPDKAMTATKINRPQVNLKKLYKWTLKESPSNCITEDLTNREISYWFQRKHPRAHHSAVNYWREQAQDPGSLLSQVDLRRSISQLLSRSSPHCNLGKISHSSCCFFTSCFLLLSWGASGAFGWAFSKRFSKSI